MRAGAARGTAQRQHRERCGRPDQELRFPRHRLASSVLPPCHQPVTQQAHMQAAECKANGFSHEHDGLFPLANTFRTRGQEAAVSSLCMH